VSSLYPRVKWIVSSHNWRNIEEKLDETHKVRLCLELNQGSISAAVGTYIRNKVDRLARLKKYDDTTRDVVQRHFLSNADNTFLWVALACQDLEKVPRWKVLAKLDTFPSGLDSLYQRMMDQIQQSDDADLCKQILAILSTVFRPIALQELTSFVDELKNMTNDDESLSYDALEPEPSWHLGRTDGMARFDSGLL
jgi:hypothetical protein